MLTRLEGGAKADLVSSVINPECPLPMGSSQGPLGTIKMASSVVVPDGPPSQYLLTLFLVFFGPTHAPSHVRYVLIENGLCFGAIGDFGPRSKPFVRVRSFEFPNGTNTLKSRRNSQQPFEKFLVTLTRLSKHYGITDENGSLLKLRSMARSTMYSV